MTRWVDEVHAEERHDLAVLKHGLLVVVEGDDLSLGEKITVGLAL